ncbi:uncharacterized protein LOC117907257 [Vitis riparia]|nr:uncharacterized protein LOC117907257 [Vitis riparia]
MEALTRQSLLSSENLVYPSFQVIAMTANLGCACCRQKVFQLTSRMTGLREYTVDVRNKRVIVKGDVKVRWNTRTESLKGKMKKGQRPFNFFFRFLKTNCINKHLVD